MSLDIQTLYLVASLVGTLLGVFLLYFWRKERIPALGWWGVAYIIGGVSIAGWTAGGDSLSPLLILTINVSGFVACGMVWTAARVFHGRKPLMAGMIAGGLSWSAMNVIPGFENPSALRMLIGAGIVAIYAVLTAGELWSERREAMRSRRAALIVPALHGTVLLLPILLGEMLLPEGSTLDGHGGWIAAFVVQLTLYTVGTVFIIVMLVSERTVSVHKLAASIDPLTGLLNRRGFSEATSRMIARETRAGRPVTVMIFDIDHFKSINDRFGHPAGDEILKLFAVTMTQTLRATDLVGRIGGEEFVAVLPCALPEALIAAERVREAFETSGIAVDDMPIESTVSIGVSGGEPGTELDVLLASADTALYLAKRSGRNRVEAAAPEEPLSLEQDRRLKALAPVVRESRVVSTPAVTDTAA